MFLSSYQPLVFSIGHKLLLILPLITLLILPSSCRSPLTTSVQSLVVSGLYYRKSQILMAALFLVSSSLIIATTHTFTNLTPNENMTMSLSYLKLLLVLTSHKLKYEYLLLAYKSFYILTSAYSFGLIYLLLWPDSCCFRFTLGFSYTNILSGPQMVWRHFFLSPYIFACCSFCPEDPSNLCPLGSPTYSSSLNADSVSPMRLFLTVSGRVLSIVPCV